MGNPTSVRPWEMVCEDLEEVEYCDISVPGYSPTWTTQTAKLRDELSNVIPSRVSLGRLSVLVPYNRTQRQGPTFSLWLYGLNILK